MPYVADISKENPAELPLPGTGEILRRHVAPFAVVLTALTSLLLFNQVTKQLPRLWGRAPISELIEIFVLSLPFIVAMTVPMAVLVAVMRVCTCLPRGMTLRRLLAPVLGAAACVAVLMYVWNGEILPRSNYRLRALLVGVENSSGRVQSDSTYRSQREMTAGELRTGIAAARGNADRTERVKATAYEVELQKKYAISAACLVFAWFAVPLGLMLRRGGWWPVIAVAIAVFSVYYIWLIVGEDLAERMMMSPFVAMWGVNLWLGIGGLALMLWITASSRRLSRGVA